MTPATFSPVTITEWPRNSRETMRVRLDMYQCRAVIDCRAWYAGPDGGFRPGRSGLTLGVKHLPALASALALALDEARTRGLV
jgi:Transcriptional Coactivator p15 (PC4)